MQGTLRRAIRYSLGKGPKLTDYDLEPRHQQLLEELYDGLRDGKVEEELSVAYGDDAISAIFGLESPAWLKQDGTGYKVTKADLLVLVREGFLTRLPSPQRFQDNFLINTARIRRVVENWSGKDNRVTPVEGKPNDGETGQAEPRVFICYSHKDMEFVNRLDQDLQSSVRTWRDVNDIPSHIAANTEGWRRVIQNEGLPRSTHMVVVLSPDSVASAEVESEWNWFLRHGRPVYPLVHRDCDISYRLENLQMYDLRTDYAGEVARLVRVLSGEESTPPAPSASDFAQTTADLTARLRELVNAGNRIEVEELIRSAVEETYQTFHNRAFYNERKAILNRPGTHDEQRWSDMLSCYFATCEHALRLLAELCWYGEETYAELVEHTVGRWLQEPEGDERYVVWRYIPSLLLVYIAGMAALYRRKWAYLSAAFNRRTVSIPGEHRTSSVIEAIVDQVFTFHCDRIGRRQGNSAVSVGQDMHSLLFPIFQPHRLSSQEYSNVFDLFELILGLFNFTRADRPLTVLPLAEIPSRDSRSFDYVADFWESGGRQGSRWELLEMGFLASSPTEMESVLTEYQETFYRRYERHYFTRVTGPPNYAGFYRRGLDDA